MKISVYLKGKGVVDALVEASPGKGISPVVLQDLTRENLKEEVGKVVADMRRPRTPSQPELV